MYILKISVTTTANITNRNTGIQNALNCQITSIRKMSVKLGKNHFSSFLKGFQDSK